MLGVNILLFIGILMVLVLVHEAGHMVVAKWCGMRVERFSIFFGKPIASFTRGETEYAIGWIPAGGYVKITGMTAAEEIPPEVADRAYCNAPVWRRIATIVAGPAVNIVLAILMFAAIFWIGVPTAQLSNRVGSVTPDSAALAAGLQPGDTLLAVNGVAAGEDPEAVRTELRSGEPGDVVTLSIRRDGRTLEAPATLDVLRDPQGQVQTDPETGDPIPGLGFTFAVIDGPTVRYGPIEGLEEGWAWSWFVIQANVEVIGDLFTSQEAREQINSVVGVGAVFNEVSDDGWVILMRFIAVVSLALGVFNLLPVLPLDGGHIVFALVEKLKGSPLSATAYERSAMVGFVLIMLVFVFALQNDIGRIMGEGFQIEQQP
ncbi:MAG: RIP metalloprotease [Miltoncostaeaceae bacterium]